MIFLWFGRTILGSGIRLFEKADHEIKLKLIKTQSYNGMTDYFDNFVKRMEKEGKKLLFQS